MKRGSFSDEFKRDAVAQFTERSYPVAEVATPGGERHLALYVAQEVRHAWNPRRIRQG